MEQLSETALVDQELERAREDLRETLEQVNHKVEQVEARLRPEAILRRNPVVLSLAAAAIGFFAGSDGHPRLFRWLATGALLGGVLAAAYRATGTGSNGTSE